MRGEILHCVQNHKDGAGLPWFNSILDHLLEILHCVQDDRADSSTRIWNRLFYADGY